MDDKTVSIGGTHIAVGVALSRLLFGRLAAAVYGIAAILLGTAIYVSGGLPPVIIAAILLIIPLAAFHMFLRREFADELGKKTWQVNIPEYLSFDVVNNLDDFNSVSISDLIEASLRTRRGRFIVQEIGKDPKDFAIHARFASKNTDGGNASVFLEKAFDVMKKTNRSRIDAAVILFTQFREDMGFRNMLYENNLSIEDLESILKLEAFHARFIRKPILFSPESLLNMFGSVGRSWIMGYTDALDRLTADLSSNHFDLSRSVRVHSKEAEEALRILEKSTLHDLLIIGDAGIGKRTLVDNIACLIRSKERSSFRAYTRILSLKTAELISGTSNPDQFLLLALKKAQESGQFILVIEDLSLMLKSGGENIRGILMKFVREKNIQLIGIISTRDYHSLIKNDPVLDQYFEKLYLEEPSDEEILAIMMEHAYRFRRTSSVHVTYKAFRGILQLSRRYLPHRAFPGKAVSVLEDSMLLAKEAKDEFVSQRHVRAIISRKSGVNINEKTTDDREKIMNLSAVLGRSVVGQDSAISALSGTLKRAAVELNEGNRPLGTFLFLGPTGVGKTHTAKVLAKEYFGSEEAMIRLDMNDYGTESSVDGITGGGSTDSYLARRVYDKPFSLILLDEIEKAHPKVLNLFLQILDEGYLIDSLGVKTDFRNAIIIATSNAGALFIRDFFGDDSNSDVMQFKRQLLDHIIKQGLFTPEFVNRFDNVIVFNPLGKEEALKVAILMLGEIINDMKEKRGIEIKVEEDVLSSIVERGYSREFGAREMRRVIMETIENSLADYMLSNEVKRGEEIIIRKESGK